MNQTLCDQITAVSVNFYSTPDIIHLSKELEPLAIKHIISDNGSNEGELSGVSSQSIILDMGKNIGYGAAVNIALERVDTKYTLVINPDISHCQNAIRELLNYLKENEFVQAISCKVINRDGTEQRASRRSLPKIGSSFKSLILRDKVKGGINQHNLSEPNTCVKVEAFSGAFFIIDTNLFKELGGFSEDYFMHVEDLDLFKRCNDRKVDLFYIPMVHVVHGKGASSENIILVEKYKHKGMEIYYKKYLKQSVWKGFRWIVPLGINLHMLGIYIKAKLIN
ncbi:MAG: glycosyltransferase [bacterium]